MRVVKKRKTKDDLKIHIESVIIENLKKKRNVEVDIRVVPDRIQIDIANEKNTSEIWETLCSTDGAEEWVSYCLYLKEARESIMKVAKEYGVQLEIDIIMYGWTCYKLKYL